MPLGSLARDLEIIIRLYTMLPEEFGFLTTRWRISNSEGLTAFEAQKQVQEAQALLEIEKHLRKANKK